MSSEQQHDLFGETEIPHKPKSVFRVNPVHVKFKLGQFLDELRELETWPWTKEQVRLLQDMTWPNLYRKLNDPNEAEKWRSLLDAEWARLTAATEWEA